MTSNTIKVRGVFPGQSIRARYNIPAGRCVIWECYKQAMKPILCRQGQVFEDRGRRYHIVSDKRYPSVIQSAIEYNKKGEPIELGYNY